MAKNVSEKSSEPASEAEAQEPVSAGPLWLSMLLTGLCVGVVVWLVIGNIPLSDFGIWPRVLVAALLLAFVVASLATTEVIPWRSRSWQEWRKPKVLGNVIYLLLGAAGFIAGVATVFNAPTADQETQDAIHRDVGKINEDTDALITGQGEITDAMGIGRQSRIRSTIEGIWGEPGCSVTYRFKLEDRSLSMVSLKSESGMTAFEEQYAIVVDADQIGPSGDHLSIMETREVGGEHDGQAVTFTYGTDGSAQWLEWKHQNQAFNAPRFVNCMKPAA